MATSANSSSQSKLSAAGSAYLTGLALLANPRRIPASNTFVFDTQLYLGPPTPQDMLIGSLHYYNSANLGFICFLVSKLIFSLLDEYPLRMCQFQAAENFCITILLVTYSR